MTELANHVWQSTAFAALVAGVCFFLRKNHARLRYWLWLAASAKFLVPFSLLVSAGSHLVQPASTPIVPEIRAIQVQEIETTFAPLPASRPVPAPARVLPFLWTAGALIVTACWIRKWRELHRLRRTARPAPIDFAIPVAISPAAVEPGVFGFLRPVLLLPQGLAETLDPEQFATVLAHERCHIEARDHLTAALHLCVCTLFWFHPAVWYIGRRLIEERERACDEAVLTEGNRAEIYAQSILNVCKHYRESPLACAPGVTGADLKRRIREIMARRAAARLTLAGKSVLAAVAVVVIAVPVSIGVLRSQTLPPPPAYSYEVVSVRPSPPGATETRLSPGPQGGVRGTNLTPMQLMTYAYSVRSYQFVNAPGWVETEHYDLSFTPDKPEPAPSRGMSHEQLEASFHRQQQRMQAVLRDRFGLVLKAETREMPIYSLVVAKSGSKLSPPKDEKAPMHMSTSRGQIQAVSTPLNLLTNSLASLLGRYVRDDTGLTGMFDFELKWAPDVQAANPEDPDGASIFTAIQEQLGLKLESKRGPVAVFVVEKIQKPESN
jgi:uncharacterized protein (TIGR03435 family)